MDNDPIKSKEGTTNNDGAGSELQLPDGANVNIYDYGERGPHWGKKISFKELPIDCQKLVINDLT